MLLVGASWSNWARGRSSTGYFPPGLFGIGSPAFTDGSNVTHMDEKSKILNLLTHEPQDAGALSTQLGISRNMLFSLLMNMEKESLIEWKGRQWAVKPSSDSKQSGVPGTSHTSQRGSDA